MEGAKILLIENDLASAEGLADLLEKWGATLAIAKSAADALDSIRALDEVPDVIVADLHLDNGETGIEAVEEIRHAINTNVPAIIVAADYSAKAASDAASFGHELLKKPIKPAEMRSLLSLPLTSTCEQTRSACTSGSVQDCIARPKRERLPASSVLIASGRLWKP